MGPIVMLANLKKLGPLGFQFGGYWWSGKVQDGDLRVIGFGPVLVCWPMKVVKKLLEANREVEREFLAGLPVGRAH